jgi:hypothetical protein
MVIYRNSLYFCWDTITILDLNTFTVTMTLELPADPVASRLTNITAVSIHAERMVVISEEKITCISLLLVGAKKSYIEALANFEEFKRLVTESAKETSSFRDSRDNSFLMYLAEFGTYAQLEHLINDDKSEEYLLQHFEPNRYADSGFTLLMSVIQN